jgi:hypothetical protein
MYTCVCVCVFVFVYVRVRVCVCVCRQGGEEEVISQEVRAPTFRCRRAEQSFVFTFRDHDASVAHAGAIKPWNQCPAGGQEGGGDGGRGGVGRGGACGVLLSLSGVGVSPNDQADAHKWVSQKFSQIVTLHSKYGTTYIVNMVGTDLSRILLLSQVPCSWPAQRRVYLWLSEFVGPCSRARRRS